MFNQLVAARYYDNNLIEYTSNDESIIQVEDGIIRAVGVGTATVNVSNGRIIKTSTVHVSPSSSPFVDITDEWTLNSDSPYAYIADMDYDGPNYGEEGMHHTTLSIDWNGTNPSNHIVRYSSNNPLVAMVDDEGHVRGYRKSGVATIRATSIDNPSIYKEIDIEVKEVTPTSIGIVNVPTSIEVGQSQNININISPINVTDKSFEVICSDDEIATCNNYGTYVEVIGNKKGTFSFTVISNSDPLITITSPEISVTPRGKINNDNKEEFHQIIRKSTGHMFLFFVYGIFQTLAIYYLLLADQKKYLFKAIAYLSAFIVGLLTASLSEIIQYFVPTRNGRFLDVLVDMIGYASAVIIVLLFFLVFAVVRHQLAKKKDKTEQIK